MSSFFIEGHAFQNSLHLIYRMDRFKPLTLDIMQQYFRFQIVSHDCFVVFSGRLVSQTPMTTALVVVTHVLAHLTVCILEAQKLVPGVAFVFRTAWKDSI